MLRLADEFARRGHRVDLVVNHDKGAYAGQISPRLRFVATLTPQNKWAARATIARVCRGDIDVLLRPILLAPTPVMGLRYVASLADYLRRERPAVMISALFYANLGAIWERRLAGVGTRLIATLRNNLSCLMADGERRPGERLRWQYLPSLWRRFYAEADRIASVSEGVAQDLAATTQLERKSIATIYNPAFMPGLLDRACERLDDKWFEPGAPPVILAAGRLEAQKDFTTLIRAFTRLRRGRPARLVILGEGQLRETLHAEAAAQGVAGAVRLPGWVDNPDPYMRAASVFVLSSAWEGLSAVLIEAMACGCSVVSTDCPSGSREILRDGRFGPLPVVGDVSAIAAARLGARSLDELYFYGMCHWLNTEPLMVEGGMAREAYYADGNKWPRLRDPIERLLLIDQIYYLQDVILTKVDRTSMASGLEVRSPLLDFNAAELSWRLPIRTKYLDGKGKWLIRELLAKYMPRSLYERPKQGFGAPVGQWLAGPLKEWAGDLLSVGHLSRQGLLNPGLVQNVGSAQRIDQRSWQKNMGFAHVAGLDRLCRDLIRPASRQTRRFADRGSGEMGMHDIQICIGCPAAQTLVAKVMEWSVKKACRAPGAALSPARVCGAL